MEAIMFDIDDTLIKVSDGKVIEPMMELLRISKMIGYTIIIITARPWYPDNVKYTKRQLASKGITYDQLHFCYPQDKTKLKKELIKRGYHFVLSVGDQPTDLTDSDNYINTSIYCRN